MSRALRSEAKAWRSIGRAFAKAVKHDEGHYVATFRFREKAKVEKRSASCLCDAVNYVMPDDAVAEKMCNRAYLNRPKRGGLLYFWPIDTAKGRTARVAFCERMAKQCEREATP